VASSQMNTPAICPVSSPSNRPARGEVNNGEAGYPKRDTSNHTEVTIHSVPDFGSIEIDRGDLTKEYK
jgi:hypothetical protein